MFRRTLPTLLLVAAACSTGSGGDVPYVQIESDPIRTGSTVIQAPPASTSTTTTTTTLPERPAGTVPAWTFSAPWGSVDGLVMFRGNPTRSYFGAGPVPADPRVSWRFPEAPMCGNSPVGGADKIWCGSGWTGQPVVWERPDGKTEVIFGAYDKSIHFLDAETGERLRPDFPMGDIIKGSVSLDPDGFPLLYTGSRDPRFRVIALDRPEPTSLWELRADSVNGMWNNDWDSNPIILDDLMFQGGENSYFFIVKLNRGYDEAGLVTIAPEVVFSMPAWTDELLAQVGRQQSIESSPVVFDQRVYWTNSAGRVVGLDFSQVVETGEAPVVFDFWAGDDIDATPIVDAAGMVYVAAQDDLGTARSREVGRLIKLDPYTDGDPIVWSLPIDAADGVAGGIWATPAIVDSTLFAVTNPGRLLAVDIETGVIEWSENIGAHAWSSAVPVDGTLVVATDCDTGGALAGYDITEPSAPVLEWKLEMETACIESTPAIWRGRMFVGSRDGFFYGFEAGA